MDSTSIAPLGGVPPNPNPPSALRMAFAVQAASCTIEHVATTLGHPVEEFLEWLRRDRVLMARGNVPYQEYINHGYFFLPLSGDGVRVTSKGQIWLAKRYPAKTNARR